MVLSMDRWVGKTAIVTGASSGIGAAIAARLVEEGLKVAGLARRRDRLVELAKKLEGKKGKLYPVQTDITREEDILKAFKYVQEKLGPIHILVNNAGVLMPGTLTDGKTEDWEKTFQVNVVGLSVATREAVRNMKVNNVGGHIVHINSIAGHAIYNYPTINVYQASKHAVTVLTECLRNELNTTDIKITSISPGLTYSEMAEEFCKKIEYRILEGRILQPDDIADGLIYVLSTPPHVQVHELTIRPTKEIINVN